MRGLLEYRISAADSISPPLASGSVSGSVSTRILLRSRPSARPPLDSGSWILESVGGWVCMRRALRRAQAPLDSGSWNLWAVGLGVRAAPGFWMLESVGGVGRCELLKTQTFLLVPLSFGCVLFRRSAGTQPLPPHTIGNGAAGP